mmetsp:Transcript_17141/g.36964  ORF Transcript_17141/g.36964 Transcript_17141/m.36964 type:complete len:547 (+) Transcript_17141:73-1713(+)|eukprot:CAMPEP_0172318132 /NCGR_PEP_ID=MMETSP1058-20130122/33933_1 /TAXON_ID=83371 /ORGANISM="Detonula confervacea, Strain CCMP 353" /LENGTH=546 /DNA_ID=CAMNT_0013032875 /DNA_START=43 /DNA_END=1680 /DNA_ORIENTATION=+
MWAAFTSDLKEFASGAAEETTAVASKVGVNISSNSDGDNGGSGSDNNGGGLYTTSSSSRGGADGSVLLANAAFSMGEKGLKGLSSVGSMMGGIVAPRNSNNDTAAANNNAASSSSSFASNKPSSALSSMLAAGKDDEEEEELGWDDDDDDLDVDDSGDDDDEGGGDTKIIKADANDFFEEELGDAGNTATPTATATPKSEDDQVLQALQSKLDMVEKARAELQNEHRRQTAELVELRAKVEELLEQQQQQQVSTVDNAGAEGKSDEKDEVQALQEEIDKLKTQLLEEQSKDASRGHENEVATLIQEKEELERELSTQKDQNDQLLKQYQTLQDEHTETVKQASQDDDDGNNSSSQEQELLLQKHQQQIEDLTSELETLQSNFESTSMELTQVKKHSEESHALAVKESEEAKAKSSDAEKEVHIVKKDMEDQAAQFGVRLQGEIEMVKAEGLVLQRELERAVAMAVDTVADAALPSVVAAADVVPEAALSVEQEQEKEVLDDASFNNNDVVQEEKASRDISPPVKLDNDGEEEELSDDWGDGDSGEW